MYNKKKTQVKEKEDRRKEIVGRMKIVAECKKKKRMKRIYKRWRRGKKRKYILLRKIFKRDLCKKKRQ